MKSACSLASLRIENKEIKYLNVKRKIKIKIYPGWRISLTIQDQAGTALKEIKAIHYCIKMLGDRITLEESDRVSGKNTI